MLHLCMLHKDLNIPKAMLSSAEVISDCGSSFMLCSTANAVLAQLRAMQEAHSFFKDSNLLPPAHQGDVAAMLLDLGLA